MINQTPHRKLSPLTRSCGLLIFLLLLTACAREPSQSKPAAPTKPAPREGFMELRYSFRPLLEKTDKVKPDWISRPFVPGLSVVYVVDRAGSMEPITKSHLARWQKTTAQIHAETIASFNAVFLADQDSLQFRISSPDKKPAMAIPDQKVFFNSSLLLLPDIFEASLKQIFGSWQGLLVAIPARNTCIVFRSTDDKRRKKVGNECRRNHDSAVHPLLSQFLASRAEGGFELGPNY